MTFEEAEKWEFNPFDLTKVWPHSEFPLIPVGRMVLDRNPSNYFAEVRLRLAGQRCSLQFCMLLYQPLNSKLHEKRGFS